MHGSIGDHVVAALAADPETIEELNAAMGRTEKGDKSNLPERPERCCTQIGLILACSVCWNLLENGDLWLVTYLFR